MEINKRGQVTIFVIVAVLAVVLILMFFLLRGTIKEKTNISFTSKSPNQQLAECVSEHIDEASKIIIQNNGYLEKTDYKKSIEFEYELLPYLCYTEAFRTRCETQEPILISHLKDELYEYLDNRINECFVSLKNDLESDGFIITVDEQKRFEVELMPRKIEVKIEKNMKFKKTGEQTSFDKITISSVSPLYDMALVVLRIVNEEARWVNSEYLNIMRANTWVEINKMTLGNDNEVYEVIDTKTGSRWRFAIKGGVFPTPR